MAKAGAELITSRRSQSLGWPVNSTFSGAGRSGAAAMSWICPSVIMISPATRARGTCASASVRADMARVPASCGPSGISTSCSVVPGMAATFARIAATAASVWAVRSDRAWLDERSTARITTSFSGLRCSTCSDGPVSAARSASADKRAQGPALQPAPDRQRHQHQRQPGQRPERPVRHQRREDQRCVSPRPSLAQPLQQRLHMHLVGFVVAGQGIHHEVDAEAIGVFALRLAGEARAPPAEAARRCRPPPRPRPSRCRRSPPATPRR